MKIYMYVKYHNNYPFGIGYRYKGFMYKPGWLSVDHQLYRAECFEEVEADPKVIKV